MSAFFLALLVFLREIAIATSSMRIGLERTKEAQPNTSEGEAK